MLKTVRQQPWQKTQLWGLCKTQDGSLYSHRRPYAEVFGSAGYSLIAKLPIQKHGPVEERIAVAENPMDRISAWLFKAPSQDHVADIG